jgi:hypothetical protein
MIFPVDAQISIDSIYMSIRLIERRLTSRATTQLDLSRLEALDKAISESAAEICVGDYDRDKVPLVGQKKATNIRIGDCFGTID